MSLDMSRPVTGKLAISSAEQIFVRYVGSLVLHPHQPLSARMRRASERVRESEIAPRDIPNTSEITR